MRGRHPCGALGSCWGDVSASVVSLSFMHVYEPGCGLASGSSPLANQCHVCSCVPALLYGLVYSRDHGREMLGLEEAARI